MKVKNTKNKRKRLKILNNLLEFLRLLGFLESFKRIVVFGVKNIKGKCPYLQLRNQGLKQLGKQVRDQSLNWISIKIEIEVNLQDNNKIVQIY